MLAGGSTAAVAAAVAAVAVAAAAAAAAEAAAAAAASSSCRRGIVVARPWMAIMEVEAQVGASLAPLPSSACDQPMTRGPACAPNFRR